MTEQAGMSISTGDKFNQGKSFRGIVGDYIWKIGQLRAVEFRGGYWQANTSVMNGVSYTTKLWVPDTREVYCNAIKFLYLIMLPQIKRYESKHITEINSVIVILNTHEQNFMKSTSEHEKVVLHLEDYKGEDKKKANSYRQEQIAIYDDLLFWLSDFWCEMDYFTDDGGITDDTE